MNTRKRLTLAAVIVVAAVIPLAALLAVGLGILTLNASHITGWSVALLGLTAEAVFLRDANVHKDTAAAAVTTGEVMQLSDGRAAIYSGLSGASSGDPIGKQLDGIFTIQKATGDTFAKGDPVFWDASASKAVAADDDLDGSADFYLGTAHAAAGSSATTVEVDLNAGFQRLRPFVYEFDCETGVDTDNHVLIPASMNPKGLLILGIYGVITEVMAGSSQDQGIVTVRDESNNTIATLTPSDSAADALGDVIVGTSPVLGASTGAAVKTVAAGEFVDAQVTQVTAGGTPAGKMRVYVLARDLV